MLGKIVQTCVFSCVLIGCASDRSSLAALSAADLEAIGDLRNAVTQAIEAGDAAAYASLCTDDVRLLHANVPLITGRAELEAHNAAMFEAVSVLSLEMTPVDVYGFGDVAYEVGTQQLSIDPPMDGFRSFRKYVHVFRRGVDGQWRFAVLMSNDS